MAGMERAWRGGSTTLVGIHFHGVRFGSEEVAGSRARRPALGESFFIAPLRGEFFPLPLISVFVGAISLELHGVLSNATITATQFLALMRSLAAGLSDWH